MAKKRTEAKPKDIQDKAKQVKIDKRLQRECELEIKEYRTKLKLDEKELFKKAFNETTGINQLLMGRIDMNLMQGVLFLTNSLLKTILALQEKVGSGENGEKIIKSTFANIDVNMLDMQAKHQRDLKKLQKELEEKAKETPSYIR